jgi:hypothetical protein
LPGEGVKSAGVGTGVVGWAGGGRCTGVNGTVNLSGSRFLREVDGKDNEAAGVKSVEMLCKSTEGETGEREEPEAFPGTAVFPGF